MKHTKVVISAGAYFALAAAVLILPVNLLLSAILAAAFHELCHLAVMWILGISVAEIRVGMGSVQIITGLMAPAQELLCAIAGPCGSFVLLFLSKYAPVLSLCGLIQGLFNLLPFYPLDGGRVFWAAIQMLRDAFAHKH